MSNSATSKNIWDQLPKPYVLLAPMEGVTDIMFRQVVARAGELAARRLGQVAQTGATKTWHNQEAQISMPTQSDIAQTTAMRPDLFFTEFTNVSSYASEKGRANALARLKIAPSDPPIIAQVWGKEPAHFAQTVAALESLGFSGVDLNYGCPDRHVNKAGGGAAMILNPELAVECIRQAQKATNLPVSVKTRLGWSKIDEFKEWLPVILKEQPAALTVHLRTKKEMSKVAAHYEIISQIVQMRDELSPKTHLIVNGDVRDRKAALALCEQFSGVDGCMIGRGVMANPFCFVETPDVLYQPTRAELIDLLKFHLDLYEQEAKTRYISFETLKHFFKIYVNNFPGAAEVRMQLMNTHDVAAARSVLAQIA